jgi:hypothetical protein
VIFSLFFGFLQVLPEKLSPIALFSEEVAYCACGLDSSTILAELLATFTMGMIEMIHERLALVGE